MSTKIFERRPTQSLAADTARQSFDAVRQRKKKVAFFYDTLMLFRSFHLHIEENHLQFHLQLLCIFSSANHKSPCKTFHNSAYQIYTFYMVVVIIIIYIFNKQWLPDSAAAPVPMLSSSTHTLSTASKSCQLNTFRTRIVIVTYLYGVHHESS